MAAPWDMMKPSHLSSLIRITGKKFQHYKPFLELSNTANSTGVMGVCGVLNALIERADKGGSFFMDVSQ